MEEVTENKRDERCRVCGGDGIFYDKKTEDKIVLFIIEVARCVRRFGLKNYHTIVCANCLAGFCDKQHKKGYWLGQWTGPSDYYFQAGSLLLNPIRNFGDRPEGEEDDGTENLELNKQEKTGGINHANH